MTVVFGPAASLFRRSAKLPDAATFAVVSLPLEPSRPAKPGGKREKNRRVFIHFTPIRRGVETFYPAFPEFFHNFSNFPPLLLSRPLRSDKNLTNFRKIAPRRLKIGPAFVKMETFRRWNGRPVGLIRKIFSF